MRSGNRGVNEASCFIPLHLERLEDALEVTGLRPVRKAVVDGLPVAVSLRQITPRCPGLEHVHDRVEEAAIASARFPAVAMNERFYLLPLCVGQFMSVHVLRKPNRSRIGKFSANPVRLRSDEIPPPPFSRGRFLTGLRPLPIRDTP